MTVQIRYFLSGLAPDSAAHIQDLAAMGAVRVSRLDDSVTHLLAGDPTALDDSKSVEAALHHVSRLTTLTSYVTADTNVLSAPRDGCVLVATLGQMVAAMKWAQVRERVPAGSMCWASPWGGSNPAMPMFVGI